MKLALFCGEAVKAETAAASSTGRGRRLPAGASRSPAPTSAQAPAQGTAYSYCTRATLWSSERVWDTLWEPPSNAGATSPQWRGRASGRSLSAGPKFSVAPSAQRHVGMTVCKPEIYIHIYIFTFISRFIQNCKPLRIQKSTREKANAGHTGPSDPWLPRQELRLTRDSPARNDLI